MTETIIIAFMIGLFIFSGVWLIFVDKVFERFDWDEEEDD